LLGIFGGCARRTAPELHYTASVTEPLRKVLAAGAGAAGGGAAAVLAEPTGWATISGAFKMAGVAPSRRPLTINKDVEVCAPGGRQVLAETVVVDSSGGVGNIVIFVNSKIPQDNPSWVHESYSDSKYGEVEFDQKSCVFLSHVATMQSTQKLKVLNSDPVGHNTNLDSKRGAAAWNQSIPSNSHQFYEPGAASPTPFSVSCSIHPWMKAWMMVCDHPYSAVTNADGSFQIANVPAGVELEFRVWHEVAGFVEQVTVDGQSEKWSKGRFRVTLSPKDNYAMEVVVNSSIFE
jgi:hypothetical protein